MTGAPGTAGLYTQILELHNATLEDARRRRAMLLSWVDEAERALGFGQKGQPPRTAQIRQWWRDSGEPDLGG
jgi:hypothetical protein